MSDVRRAELLILIEAAIAVICEWNYGMGDVKEWRGVSEKLCELAEMDELRISI